MKLILKTPQMAIDASKGATTERVIIHEGEHEVERIEHPFGLKNDPWLVLKGTKTGAPEGYWRRVQQVEIIDEE